MLPCCSPVGMARSGPIRAWRLRCWAVARVSREQVGNRLGPISTGARKSWPISAGARASGPIMHFRPFSSCSSAPSEAGGDKRPISSSGPTSNAGEPGPFRQSGVPPPRLNLRENIYNIPNLLTMGRICATPAVGYFIYSGDLAAAVGLLFVAGMSDVADGYIARKYSMGTVLGSILDPAADKFLMTTLITTMAYKSMIPLPLAVIILGRDVLLSISAFFIRYKSLPEPKTLARYFSPSTPSAEVHPTQISKYNTFLQLSLVGLTLLNPLTSFDLNLVPLQWLVGATTIVSGLSYVNSSSAVKYLSK